MAGLNFIDLTQNKRQRLVFLNVIMKFGVPLRQGFLTT
jgi:hypothetical protein